METFITSSLSRGANKINFSSLGPIGCCIDYSKIFMDSGSSLVLSKCYYIPCTYKSQSLPTHTQKNLAVLFREHLWVLLLIPKFPSWTKKSDNPLRVQMLEPGECIHSARLVFRKLFSLSPLKEPCQAIFFPSCPSSHNMTVYQHTSGHEPL